MSKSKIIYKEIAPGADRDMAATSQSASGFSQLEKLPVGMETEPRMTLEHNQWLLNGRHTFIGPEVFWSKETSNEKGYFSVPPSIVLTFGGNYASPGLTFSFDPVTGMYCSEVRIVWYQGKAVKEDKTFYPTGPSYFFQQPVVGFDRIEIYFIRTCLPNRYVRLNRILFGIYREFGMTELRGVSIINQSNGLSAELPVSTMDWQLYDRDNINYMFLFKQPVEVWNNDTLIGVYYIDAHTRKSTSLYDISCYDAIGVLGDALFPGGVYTNKSAKQLLTEIIGNDFEIVFDDVDDISLTGAIFSGTKREACQQVLFAWGCAVSTDGRYSIRVYNPGTQVKEVGVDRTYTGASTSVGAIVTEVRITAHTYIPSEQGTVEIGGEKYEDVTSLYTIENPDATETDKANVIEIENATLVSPSNAQEVAQRVYAYYEKRYLSTAKIVWSDEKLGETLQVPTNWGGMQTGDVEKMEIKLSNTVAAQCEIRSAGGQSDHNRSVT